MKLKLETQDQVTLLLVTDTVELAHVPVLKAGLTKLFQSGKKNLLLDLSSIAETQLNSEPLRAQLADLRPWALSQDANLVIVSSVEKLGNAKSRGEGIALLTSPLAQQQALELKLRMQLQQLEAQKAKLTQALNQLGSDAELKKVRTRNSQLRKTILEIEKIAKRYLAKRSTRKKIPQEPDWSGLTGLLDGFLKKEGVLP